MRSLISHQARLAAVTMTTFVLTLAALFAATTVTASAATTKQINGVHGKGTVNFATVRYHAAGAPLKFKLTSVYAYCNDTWGISMINSVSGSRFAGWKNYTIYRGAPGSYGQTVSWGNPSAINFRVSARAHAPSSSVQCLAGLTVQQVDFTGNLTY